MNRQSIVVVLLLLPVGAVIWASPERKSSGVAKLATAPVSTTASLAPARITTATSSPTPLVFTQKPGGPFEPSDPRWQWWNENMKRDPSFQWKMPISFYGKVVDENGMPVQNALVKIGGTNLSVTGSFSEPLVSDARGLFSLTGKTGKFLSVEVNKDGYYTSQAENHTGFEYAAFSDPYYYKADQNDPVIFHLRAKGEPAPLASYDGEFVMSFGEPCAILMPLEVGTASPIHVTVFENNLSTRTWRATISVEGGGVQPAMEEFPFEAPENRYQSSIDLTEASPRSSGWKELGQGGLFYFKTNQGYGLLKLQQHKGKRTLHYTVIINTRGGRNLEPAR